MKKTLLVLVAGSLATLAYSQKDKEKPITGYAITGQQKGQTGWREVRQVDIKTGEELQSVYKGTAQPEILNARTGKPVVKKDPAPTAATTAAAPRVYVNANPAKKVVNLDNELMPAKEKLLAEKIITEKLYVHDKSGSGTVTYSTTDKDGNKRVIVLHRTESIRTSYDKPFATMSAAMAYDKKHDRLYYTPMNINQLRYIDLKSNKVYYFEDEAFGTMTPGADIGNQITRMAFGSDGDGYALSNDANHLIRFTAGKKPTITDLGALTDDAANGTFSVHKRSGFGGDMVADASGNLYLITANRNVFKISIETKVAKYLGVIKGLPQGYNTNGAMVEEGSKVIVCSSESTLGYFRFDLNTLEAEQVSSGTVFNASDLANGNLAFEKEKKKEEEKKDSVTAPVEQINVLGDKLPANGSKENAIVVFPNPATSSEPVKVSFPDLPAGKYQLQVLDMSGKLVSSQEVNLAGKSQIADLRLPSLLGAGTYIVKVFSEENKVSSVTKLVVQ